MTEGSNELHNNPLSLHWWHLSLVLLLPMNARPGLASFRESAREFNRMKNASRDGLSSCLASKAAIPNRYWLLLVVQLSLTVLPLDVNLRLISFRVIGTNVGVASFRRLIVLR